IYNPTSQTVDFKKWSLSYKTRRYIQKILITYQFFVDTTQSPPWYFLPVSFTSTFTPDSVATYDVPIVRTADSIRGILWRTPRFAPDTILAFALADTSRSLRVGPNQFLTLVSNLDRLRVYNTIGPGEGPDPTSTPYLPMQNPLVHLGIVERDSLYQRLNRPDTLISYVYDFYLDKTDQIVLKDSTGQAVDVVRYGNYTFTGPGPDPYPTYRSIGLVPDYESIARYAGAYDTKNTANDFYITRPGLRPIPHWLSQLWKK
ncbi:MAG TPA: hypothetical protein VNL69_07960, partial [Bacteroidota bacterium]|nr:hypothetical protein [Bacteroidota bacterium]